MKLVQLFGLMLILLAPASQASLIVNGSFEDNVVGKNSWSWFSASQVNGWEGSNLELWHNFNGVKAQDGNQFLELNAHGNNSGSWSVYQQFATVTGMQYELSFAYRARNSRPESFSVSVADFSQSFVHNNTGSWTVFTGWFTASDSSSLLRFTSLMSGTEGNFIDAVRVNALPTASRSVSLASSLSLLAFGAAMLLWRRRRA